MNPESHVQTDEFRVLCQNKWSLEFQIKSGHWLKFYNLELYLFMVKIYFQDKESDDNPDLSRKISKINVHWKNKKNSSHLLFSVLLNLEVARSQEEIRF